MTCNVRRPTIVLGAALLLMPILAARAVEPMRKVTLAVGTTVINTGYPSLTLPLHLGYWTQEGLDVDLEPVGASLQALQQMEAGNAQFAEVDAGVVVQANTRDDLAPRFVMSNGVIDWSIGVPPGSSIHSVSDLKGKTIGTFSLATGGLIYLRSYLRRNGLDPERDVQILPLGLGAQPVQALRRGQVDALFYWAAAMASFGGAGLPLRFMHDPAWRRYPDFSLSVMQDTAVRDPDMVVGLARGIAKAEIFALANPDCALRIEEKAEGNAGDPGHAAQDLAIETAQLDSARDAFALGGGQYRGRFDSASIARLEALMLEAKLIDHTMPEAQLLVQIPNFSQRVNDFDPGPIKDAARACRMAG
ncbi:MAG: ABC transporter substrate-binding protein [Janthinobacterium lividum]